MRTDKPPAADRAPAVIEVLLVYGAVIGLFALLDTPSLNALQTRWFDRRGILQYTVSGLVIIAFLAIRGPGFEAYGVTLSHLRRDLRLAGRGFVPIFLLGVALSGVNWERWPGAILISLLEIGLLIWLVRALRPQEGPQKEADLGPAIGACLALGCGAVAWASWGRVGPALRNLAITYLVTVPVEELLFRGYIQSRLDRAFGRPYRTGGISWGWGLIITSLLFGVWHLGIFLQPPDWPHALWTLFCGLLFGCLRERSGTIVPSSLLHGVMNYGPQAFIYELLF